MPDILLVKSGAVATVTFNRPEAMNALSANLRRELAAAMLDVEQDPAIKVVILTGSGQRAFTAGMDLKEIGQDTKAIEGANATAPSENPVKAIEQCTKPVIGAINGVAAAGGFEVALACDVLIASSAARFADTHVRVGVLPGWGLSQRLSRLIGLSRAKELSLTGNFLDADTAAAWGLVNRVVAPDELIPAAEKLAQDMAQVGLSLLVDMKRLIDGGYALTYAEGLEFEAALSSERNAKVTSEEVEARRQGILARGRSRG